MKKVMNNVNENVKVSIDKETIINLLNGRIVDMASNSDHPLAKFIIEIASEANRLEDITKFALTGNYPTTKYPVGKKVDEIYSSDYYFYYDKNSKISDTDNKLPIVSEYKHITQATITKVNRFAKKPYTVEYTVPKKQTVEGIEEIINELHVIKCNDQDLDYFENK